MINRLIQRTTGKAMGDYGCMLRATAAISSTPCSTAMSAAPLSRSGEYLRPARGGDPGDARRARIRRLKYSFMRLINLMYDR